MSFAKQDNTNEDFERQQATLQQQQQQQV